MEEEVMGCVGWWGTPSLLVLPQGCGGGQGYSQQVSLSRPFHLDFLLGFPAEVVVLLPKVTWMELTGRNHSLQVVDSPAGHGSEGCWTLWMGNHDTCCTPGLACSAWFGGD